jgi:hypothetical protein
MELRPVYDRKPLRFHCIKGKNLNWSVDGFSIDRVQAVSI